MDQAGNALVQLLHADGLAQLYEQVSQPQGPTFAPLVPDIPAIHASVGVKLRDLLADDRLMAPAKLERFSADVMAAAFSFEPGPLPDFNVGLIGDPPTSPSRLPKAEAAADSNSIATAAAQASAPTLKISFRMPDASVEKDDSKRKREKEKKHKHKHKHRHSDDDGDERKSKKRKKHKDEHQTIAH